MTMEADRMIALRLAKEGYGTPQQILEMPADLVADILDHSQFTADYEATYAELNKP